MTLLRAVKFSRSATNDKQQVVLSHVLSAVRKKPRFKKKKKTQRHAMFAVTKCLSLLRQNRHILSAATQYPHIYKKYC